MAVRKALGRPMSGLYGQVAAIAKAHGGAVATCNTRDFEHCGIELVDPFVAAPPV